VAHIYGQNLAAAESMTAAAAPWAWSPSTLKPTADQEFLNGINRFVIHESAHQPLGGQGSQGLRLGRSGSGSIATRPGPNDAGPWIDYLARTSYMLQQGHYAADLFVLLRRRLEPDGDLRAQGARCARMALASITSMPMG
jgi:hypothetical protein